ncbi:ATP-binding protein [Natronoarchaeum mannanilyticum]|uniref:histidine kinase n=1 Tax=Natronoarchaeum mannanilyticum TaxID=926360 RepID=A0AAV3T575_9EURY
MILALGGLYVASGIAWPLAQVRAGMPPREGLSVAVLSGGAGIALLYGGYRLPETDVRPEFFATVAVWCLRGVVAIAAVLVFLELLVDLTNVVANVLILSPLAGVAGFAAGLYDARARTRTRELELRNRELERTKAELEDTVDQLRTSNERLEEFAYAASHDLQEPMRMVSSYLQLLEKRYGDDLDEDAEEYIDFAVGGADRMRAMIESLLAYSRVSTGGEPLEPTDAEAALETILDDFAPTIEETDATITADELPTVRADPEQLEQVFRNLLSNALAFSGDDPPKVHVGADREGDEWRFSVADEGIGIEGKYQDQIFNVFERMHADQSGAGDDHGGIGLALCERIVERHGGRIWVESDPGEGATFYFTVPAVGSDADDPERPAEPDSDLI